MPFSARSQQTERPRYTGIVMGALGILAIWGVGWLGGFSVVTELIYDLSIQYGRGRDNGASHVVLIDYAPAFYSERTWIVLIKQLEAQGAAQVVLTSPPANLSSAFYEQAARHGNILFGRRLDQHPSRPDSLTIDALPDAAASHAALFGAIYYPPSRHGVHRHQHAFLTADGATIPALEILAAQGRLGTDFTPLTHPYRLNFSIGSGALPRFSLDRVLSGGLVPELIRGRSILIGPSEHGIGLVTPLNPQAVNLSMLEFHGYALETLLSGSMIIELSPLLTLLGLVVLAVVSLVMFQWLDDGWPAWITIFLLPLYIGAAGAIFMYAALWLPLTEILLVQAGAYVLTGRERSIRRDFMLRKLMFESTATLQESGVNFYTSPEHWSHVSTMLSQTLDLQRSILLERVPDDHRLREVVAWQCSFDDIYERRRDYHREPYHTALKERGPIKATDRLFFSEAAEQEDQYLVPLIFAGDILGFWVFCVGSEQAAGIVQFETIIAEFGRQIATLLYRRQEWRSNQQALTMQTLNRYLQLEGGDQDHLALQHNVMLIQQRLSRIEMIFADLGVATIVYDLFGHALYANQRMTGLLTSTAFEPQRMTLLDLILSLCGLDLREAREIMRTIVLQKGARSLPAALPHHHEHHYVLHLRPVTQDETDAHSDTETAYPFYILGIIGELIDVTDVKRSYDTKSDIVETVYSQILRDTEGVIESLSTLAGQIREQTEVSTSINQINRKANGILESIKETYDLITINDDPIFHVDSEMHPVNVLNLIESLLKDQAGKKRQTEINFTRSSSLALGFASPLYLKEILQSILHILSEDAFDRTAITVTVEEQAEWILCTMADTGFGMPDEALQAYLFGQTEVDSEHFATLRHRLPHIPQWEGELSAWSEVGTGIQFSLRLKRFVAGGPERPSILPPALSRAT